jgi:hypothetical protein
MSSDGPTRPKGPSYCNDYQSRISFLFVQVFFSVPNLRSSLSEREKKLNPAERTRLKSVEEAIKGVKDTYRDPTV